MQLVLATPREATHFNIAINWLKSSSRVMPSQVWALKVTAAVADLVLDMERLSSLKCTRYVITGEVA